MEQFKTWEEMSVLEQYASQYWDMYKDAYGIRPRGIDTSTWTEQDFEREFQILDEEILRGEKARRADEAQAVVKFSKRIEQVIQAGAGDRETALRWIHEADGSNGDNDFLCYINHLPYGYLDSKA